MGFDGDDRRERPAVEFAGRSRRTSLGSGSSRSCGKAPHREHLKTWTAFTRRSLKLTGRQVDVSTTIVCCAMPS
jgi:hypothetical protein